MTLYLQRAARFQAGVDGHGDRTKRGGHTYNVTLTVSGQIDPTTGMVVNIRDIDQLLKRQVLHDLDGAILDRDLAEFCDLPSTDENLVSLIWNRAASAMASGARLEEVVLSSSPSVSTALSRKLGNREVPMLTVTRQYDFSAAHRLHVEALSEEQNLDYFGKCNWEHGHGHNYGLEVTLSGEPNSRTGELASAAQIDAVVEREVLSRYDHKNLNYDVEELYGLNPTSENVTRVIWERLRGPLNDALGGRAGLYRVAVRETERNYFEYFGN